ncbi:hypothetical protein G6F65_023484 [Rhizopus arrhizus]|nr:hypothetical protein G6F65_023484 [Rhizopus arrhizus]
MSYLRTSRLSNEPSPIQPPAGTPVSDATLPSALPTDTLTNPANTPIHAWASSPLRSMIDPATACCTVRSRSPRGC